MLHGSINHVSITVSELREAMAFVAPLLRTRASSRCVQRRAPAEARGRSHASRGAQGRRQNPEHRELIGDRLECLERRVLVHGQVWPCAGRTLQVLLQHGSAPCDLDLFEAHLLRASMAQHGVARSGSHVANPRGVWPEHRDQVSLSSENGHHERERDRAPRSPAHDLQRDPVVRADAARVNGREAAIDQPSQRTGASASVEPALDSSRRQAESASCRRA